MSTQENADAKMSPLFNHLPDSDNYIRKLESRLLKVKGLDRNPSSKEMISVLQKARDDSMKHFISASADQLSSLDFDADKEVPFSYVERKLFPEKNGVTYEELQHLLESDFLAKLSGDRISSTDSSVDR